MICKFYYPLPMQEKILELLTEQGFSVNVRSNHLSTDAPEGIVDKAIEEAGRWIPMAPRQSPMVINGLSID